MTLAKTWKEKLGSSVPEAWSREIDVFETQIELRKKGKIEEKLFAETRLRRGTYGQRYDNGQRHDGEKTQTLPFPSAELTKGPVTMWDAPGMQRIKIPYGGLNATQLEMLADLCEEYSDGIAHIAAAVGLPSVVIFGSSNTAHWRPWATAPAEVVLEEMDCQPCHGYYCEKFAQPECILRVPLERVIGAVDRVLRVGV